MSLQKIKKGDILVNRTGNRRKVLGICRCGDVYFMSTMNSHDEKGVNYTLMDLNACGYTLDTPPSPSEQKAIKLLESKGYTVTK